MLQKTNQNVSGQRSLTRFGNCTSLFVEKLLGVNVRSFLRCASQEKVAASNSGQRTFTKKRRTITEGAHALGQPMGQHRYPSSLAMPSTPDTPQVSSPLTVASKQSRRRRWQGEKMSGWRQQGGQAGRRKGSERAISRMAMTSCFFPQG